MIVLHVAIDFRTSPIRAVLSRLLTANWNRRLKSSSLREATWAVISSLDISRISLAFIGFTTSLSSHGHVSGPVDELALHRQLVHGEAHRFLGNFLADTSQLEHDPALLHHSNPRLRVALTGAH